MFSIEAIPCLTALPLQARLGLLFLFCLLRHFALVFRKREARCFSAGKDGYLVSESFSRQLPVATAAHNWPTQLQQGWSAASVVSFPYPASKTAHKAAQGRSGAALVSFPYPASKTAQRATQGRVWLSLSFPGALLLR